MRITDEVNEVFNYIISFELTKRELIYCAPDAKGISMRDIVFGLMMPRCKVKNALTKLRKLGLVEYKFKGYMLTEQGFESKLYKAKYEEWLNGKSNA